MILKVISSNSAWTSLTFARQKIYNLIFFFNFKTVKAQWPLVITSSDITRFRLQRDSLLVPNYNFTVFLQ